MCYDMRTHPVENCWVVPYNFQLARMFLCR